MTTRAIRLPLGCAVVVALAGCGGPKIPLEIGMNEAAVDIIYGDHDQPPDVVQPRPSGASFLPPTAPGFISAPAPLPVIRFELEPERKLPPKANAPAGPACADPKNMGAVTDPAPASVNAGPTPGRYRFRRDGTLATADTQAGLKSAPRQPLSPEIVRDIANVRTATSAGPQPAYTFDAVETSPGLRSTTSYTVDSGRSDTPGSGGLFIDRIVTERTDLPPSGPAGAPGVEKAGVESFNPSPPIRIMDLPAQPTQTQSFGLGLVRSQSTGTDPLTGASMTIVYGTDFRRPVNACGTVIDAWQVRIFPESSYSRESVRSFSIAGTFKMAPQLGGLIVEDGLTLVGKEVGGRSFEQQSTSTVNSVRPAKQ